MERLIFAIYAFGFLYTAGLMTAIIQIGNPGGANTVKWVWGLISCLVWPAVLGDLHARTKFTYDDEGEEWEEDKDA
jgi:hypothetical protein